MSIYHDRQTMNLLKQIIKEEKPCLLYPSELFLLYTFAKSQRLIAGDYAEVGVFKGTSAKIICEAKGDQCLHLFDTFEGLLEIEETDKSRYQKKMFKVDFNKICKKFANYPKVFFHKGFFPKTAETVKDKKFAFVHLDCDLYQSTRDCLEFFYPRMSAGGIIISHDYHILGVKKAFSEFFFDKPESITPLHFSQCLIIKCF